MFKRFTVITQCCIEDLYREGSSQQGAVDVAKTFERRKCNHREPIDGLECVESVIGEYLGAFASADDII